VFEVLDGADMVGWVGHDRGLEATYFELKGAATPQTAAAVRKHWPDDHGVSRLDSCEDFREADSYERLQGIFLGALDPRVKAREIASLTGDDGRTTYVGSAKSRVMARLYEAGKMRERAHFNAPEWVRAEVQVRPGKAAEKRLAAKLDAAQAWGFSAWSQRVAHALGAADVDRYSPPSMPVEFDRTTLYIARAFRRHFEQMALDCGSWECIGREFKAVWAGDDQAETERAQLGRAP
jgi:hypothetical protein